ncbi:MAG: DUF3604 domain-containing protein [Candidatus Dormibacteria bacterium]
MRRNWYDVAVQRFDGRQWREVWVLPGSDGDCDEPCIVPIGVSSVTVAWRSTNRKERLLEWEEGSGGREQEEVLRSHFGEAVWNSVSEAGACRCADLAGVAGTVPAQLCSVAVSPPAEASRVDARRWAVARIATARAEPYQIDYGKERLTLYWGNLHRHTNVSRCNPGWEPGLEDQYRYARDISEYDFLAITDHAEHTSARNWWNAQMMADLFHMPASLVVLYGYEWTSAQFGHYNVIYGEAERPLPIYSARASFSDTPEKLWSLLAADDRLVMTIPHHPGVAWAPWDSARYSAEFVRLIEIFQACTGSYEADGCFRQAAGATAAGHFVADALTGGLRLGLCCSTDHNFGSSYTAIYAPRLDRSAVFAALRARRCYGATTRDIQLDFRVGGWLMGEAVESIASEDVGISVRVDAYAMLSKIQIVGPGGIVAELGGLFHRSPRGVPTTGIRVDFGRGPAGRGHWDGEITVATGRFVATGYYSPGVTSVERRRIRWECEVRGPDGIETRSWNRHGLDFGVQAPLDTMLTVRSGALEWAGSVGEICDGQVGVILDDGSALTVSRSSIGALTSLGIRRYEKEIRLPLSELPEWVYLRVVLVDGEMAWSSPIWLPARRAGRRLSRRPRRSGRRRESTG